MHREISHTDEVFQPPSHTSLFALTGLLGVLLTLDLGPVIAAWLSGYGLDLPTWPRGLGGYRFALIAAVVGGARVLYGSLEGLFDGKVGADLALALAAIAAILLGEPLVAAEVVFIGMVGECLEAVTFARTQRAVRRLVEVFPRRCWRLTPEGTEERVLTADLQVGDRVVVKPGGKVPVDGIVRDGRSAVDVSALTGESLPADKGPGDEVLAGSINQFGALTIEAVRVSEQTVAGQVIALTAAALKDKAPLERTADRLARYFLPVVLTLAVLTFLAQLVYHVGPLKPADARLGISAAARLSAYPALAVLVVACPCGLILATPAAVIAALGRLAGTGVLIKGGSALERLAGINAIAFDKTGTLTEGRLELGDLISLDDASLDELLREAATAEQASEHPLGRLLVQEAAARGLTLQPIGEFRALPGAGVAAGELLVGNRRLMEEHGVALPSAVIEALERLDATGQTPLIVARAGVVRGVIGARDRLRPEAAAVIAELRDLGITDISLLTGDRAAVARPLAEQLGIDDVHAELLPAEKAERVAASPRAFVGDGINDAPALARSTVGLAVAGGTDLAAEAGDIVLMRDPLGQIPLLIRLSRQTVAIIRQNIYVFAFGVNLVGVVLTAWLWPLLASSPEWYERSPLVAVLYHQFGSLAVLINSMRLLAFERSRTSPTLAALSHVVRSIDQKLEHWLDLDELLHTVAHHARAVVATVLIVGVAVAAASGLTQIGPDEVGVVRRFGRVQDADLTPGLHWRWPWPIEAVSKIKPDAVRTVEVGFRAVAQPAALTWATPHDSVRRYAEEAVMVTGDGNLVELLATVRYRVADPRLYLFGTKEPDEVLRRWAECELRTAVAGQPFLDLLTTRRSELPRLVFDRLQARVESAEGRSLGIALEGLALHDLHPPQEVVASFHEVAKAMEARDRMMNDALAQAARLKRDAEGRGLAEVRRAEAAAHRTVEDAKAARDGFLAWHRARTELSSAAEAALAAEAIGRVLAGGDPRAVAADYVRRRQEILARQRDLIDFRLAWESLTRVLAGRDKVLIDSDKLPGKRTMLLFDPDVLRPPIVLPGDRRPLRDDGP